MLCEVACLRCHDSALRRELDIVGKPPLIRNIVALGRRRSIGRGAARDRIAGLASMVGIPIGPVISAGHGAFKPWGT